MAKEFGFRSIVVPVAPNEESERAVDVACRLASTHGLVTLVSVVEIPQLLPFDAHMTEEERRAHLLIERQSAIVDTYGIGVSRRIVRARDPAAAIVLEAESANAELIVIGAVSGRGVEHVLRHAPCRVLLIGPPGTAIGSIHAAA